MEKRLVYNLLKGKGYEMRVNYYLTEDGEIQVSMWANRVVVTDDYKAIGEFICLSWFNDTLCFATYMYDNEVTGEEIYNKVDRYCDTDYMEKACEMICNA